jgi:hypothetical protein
MTRDRVGPATPSLAQEVVTEPAPKTREPRRSAVYEALCRTRTGDPFLTMAVWGIVATPGVEPKTAA